MNAARVFVAQPRVAGSVTAKTSDTITVRRANGTSATVKVGSGTTYRVRGVDNPTLADVKVGMVIVAEGTQNSDGSLSAASVAAGNRLGRGKPNFPGPFRAPNTSPSPATPG
jgi:hypothetical protein